MAALSPRLTWTVAAACALVVGSVVGARVAGIEPSLRLKLHTISTTGDWQTFELRAEPRGGESMAAIRLEIAEGYVGVLGKTEALDVPPDNAARFTLRIRRDSETDPLVRIVQEARVNRTYDLRIPVDHRRAPSPPEDGR
ncbi:MAG: hypothetical protein K8T90_06200 [Planctomycetes bacterium]|nr:hypothetical protein [Planctomycetota bacterium]